MKFGLKKVETLLYRMVQRAFQCVEPFRCRCGSRVWQTDRQTDGRTNRWPGSH